MQTLQTPVSPANSRCEQRLIKDSEVSHILHSAFWLRLACLAPSALTNIEPTNTRIEPTNTPNPVSAP
jgi:hypothetical protein